MRTIGIDVHQSFCEVAICERGKVRSAGRIETSVEALELFAESLGADDRVAMETSGPAFAIARILKPHVGEVIVTNAAEVRAISHARVKSDRFDARTLARLAESGMLGSVWVPDPDTAALRRRIARRAALVRQRTKAKNEIHAVLARCLLGKPQVADLFGVAGRRWLERLELAAEEQETLDGCLREVDFCDREVALIDRKLAEWAVASAEVKRLMTIPGIGMTAAVTLMSAIGEIGRFDNPRKLVAYLGLDPTSRQSGDQPARGGRISKRGNVQARSVLVEAAWTAIRSPGPLRAFGERVRSRHGGPVAAVAVARKIAVLSWHLLSREEDYAFGRPSLVRSKLRAAQRLAGAPALAKRHGGQRVSSTPAERAAERELAQRAEAAYRRTVADWRAGGKVGAGATEGRAS